MTFHPLGRNERGYNKQNEKGVHIHRLYNNKNLVFKLKTNFVKF